MKFIEEHNRVLENIFYFLTLKIKKFQYFIASVFTASLFYFLYYLISNFHLVEKIFYQNNQHGILARGFILFIVLFLFFIVIVMRSKIALLITFLPWLWSLACTALVVDQFFVDSQNYFMMLMISSALASNFSLQLYDHVKEESIDKNGLSQIVCSTYFVQGKKTLRLFVPVIICSVAFLFHEQIPIRVLGFMIIANLFFSLIAYSLFFQALVFIFLRYTSVHQSIEKRYYSIIKRPILWAVFYLVLAFTGVWAFFDMEINHQADHIRQVDQTWLITFIALVMIFIATIRKIYELAYYFVPLFLSYTFIFLSIAILQLFHQQILAEENYFITAFFNAISFTAIYMLYTNLRRLKKQDLELFVKETSGDLLWLFFSLFIAFAGMTITMHDSYLSFGIIGMTLSMVLYLQFLVSFPLTIIFMKKILYRSNLIDPK